jgi:hypothetical protein
MIDFFHVVSLGTLLKRKGYTTGDLLPPCIYDPATLRKTKMNLRYYHPEKKLKGSQK